MIPDKIYIRHYWMPGELDDEWRLKPVEDEQCEEYIRKDALFEMLKGYSHPLTRIVVQELIDKINEL